MSRTVVTLLVVSVLALPATLAAGGLVGLAAAGPVVDPGGASRSGGETGITHFTMEGRGPVADRGEPVTDHADRQYVWASEPTRLATTAHVEPDDRPREGCIELLDDEGERVEDLGCEAWTASTQWKRTTHALDGWPANTSGPHVVRVELLEPAPRETDAGGNGTGRVQLDAHESEVYVVSKQGDLDGDGLTNGREVELGTDFTDRDTDGDGVSDRAEVYRYDTDPRDADTAGDGVEDGTAAAVGLPPTVPYVVPAVAAAGLLGVAAVSYAGIRLRRVLRTRSNGPTYGARETVSAVGSGDADDADDFPGTKEDEVLAVIREHDGRMRQADLVEETEWSKATVSRLLSTLEEEGRVEKIRIGRGNVVQLTGPDATFDDDRGRASD